jgi:hypothetical protein
MQSQRVASLGGIRVAGGVAAVVLLVAALLVLASGDVFRFVTGLPRGEALSAPDDVHGAARDDPMPFLISRDVLEVRVDAPVTVRELLEGNRLNKPNLRRQVLEQLGNPSLDSMVSAGTTLRLNLTPEAADVPATSTQGKRR